jgi:hypothetical protein
MIRASVAISFVFGVALLLGAGTQEPQYVFAVAAMLIFGFLTIGFLLFPKLKALVPFSLGPIGASAGKDTKVLVAGTEVLPSDFPQYFTCVFQVRLWLLLLALAALSISAFCLLVSNGPLADLIQQSDISSIYGFALATLLAFSVSAKWYSEQSLLAKSAVTFGTVTGVNEVNGHRELRYEFRDAAGGYFGGMQRDFLSRKVDNVVFVLYDQSNPDKNSSSRGFMFRSFKVYPSRQTQQEEPGRME